MYRIILLDDEEIIREGLVDFIPWSELGFDLVATFEDGKDAIAYLDHNSVDVILSDIMMAEVSGLELAEYVCQHHPRTKMAILSGYKEFEFAQQAIQCNVKHYLLKPMELDELRRVLRQLKQELDEEHEAMEEKRRSHELLPLLQEQFFSDLLMGALWNSEEMLRRSKLIQLPYAEAGGCCVIELELEAEEWSDNGWESFVAGLRKWVLGARMEHFRMYPVLNSYMGYRIVGVFAPGSDMKELLPAVQAQLEKIRKSAAAIFNVRLRAVGQSVYGDLAELARSSSRLRSYRESVKPITELAEPEEIRSLGRHTLEEVVKETVPHKSVSSMALVEKAQQFMSGQYHLDLSLEQVADQVFLHPVYFSRLFKQCTGMNFSDYLMRLRIERAMELLREGDLKVYEAGQRVGYGNAKYFNRVFKQVTGMTPRDYVRQEALLGKDRL